MTCQACPAGAACDGSTLRGLVAGSVWQADASTGQYRLISCPRVRNIAPWSAIMPFADFVCLQGYQLMNSNGRFFWYDIQQCFRCSQNQYILNSNNPSYSCMDCPVGAICDGSSLRGIVPGSMWKADLTTGEYILQSCPKVSRILLVYKVSKL